MRFGPVPVSAGPCTARRLFALFDFAVWDFTLPLLSACVAEVFAFVVDALPAVEALTFVFAAAGSALAALTDEERAADVTVTGAGAGTITAVVGPLTGDGAGATGDVDASPVFAGAAV
jgi:hypothetical protein